MNLNYDPSAEALAALIASASHISMHNLIIDFDGEVLIDPEMYYPEVPVHSYKFKTIVADSTLRSADEAESLYAALYILYRSLDEPEDHRIANDQPMGAAA